MTTDVGIRVGVDGEKEFKSSLAAVNAQLRNLNSEMQSTVAAFAGMEDSEEAVAASSDVLQRSISAQQQKLSLLSGQYDRSKDKLSQLGDELDQAIREFGESSKEAGKAQNAYNRQAAEVNNLGSQVNKATADLRTFERQLADVGKSADDLSDDLDDAGKGFSGFSGKLKGVLAGGAIVGSLSGIADGISNIVNESLEYNKIMGTLEVSSQKAGYSAEQTAVSYTQLYGIIGDEQQSATALANLQALGLEQDQLTVMTDAAIGAWATYGDSIPIDSLAEAINETIQAGVVTGTFADVLNWAGTSEDDFNEKLAACSTKSERVQLVMDELAKQQLPGAAAGWRENNAELVKMNEANVNLSAAMGELGLVFTPVVATFKNGLATMVLGFVDLVHGANEALDKITALGPDIAKGLWEGISSADDWLYAKIQGWCGGIIDNVKDFFGIHSPSTVFKKEIGQMLGLGVAEGITDSIPEAVNMARNLASEVTSAASGMGNTEKSEFLFFPSDVFDQTVEELTEKQPILQEYVTDLMDSLSLQVLDYDAEFRENGHYLMKGVAQGIQDGRSEVVNEVRRALEAAAEAAREAMEINSPSKVFAKIGDYMAQGVGEGFTVRMRDVTGDIAAAMPTRQNVLPALAGANNGRSYTYGDINLFIDKVDNGNGRSIETMAKELEFYRRQQAGGRGGKT